MRCEFELATEPTGACYLELLKFAFDHCSFAYVVVREGCEHGQTVKTIGEDLKSSIVSVVETSEWPGTVLLSGKALVYTFQLDYRAKDYLQTKTARLFGWILPELPEDLGLLRADHTGMVMTVTHERDAMLSLEENELKAMRENHPALHRLLRQTRSFPNP